MANTTSLIYKFTPELLFFTWKRLRIFGSSEISNDFCIPIPSIWFKKVSSLIRSGRFKYAALKNRSLNLLKYKKKKHYLQVKARIIEQAFIFIVRPCFQNYFLFKSSNNLKEYLTRVFADFLF